MRSVKYIYRIDTYCAHGWQVRLLNDRISKVFSDSLHGGKRKAMAAAKIYLKKAVSELPPTIRKKHEGIQKHGRIKSKGYFEGEYGYHAFYWVPGQGIKQKFLSYRKHGKRKAKQLALEFRKVGLAKIAR